MRSLSQGTNFFPRWAQEARERAVEIVKDIDDLMTVASTSLVRCHEVTHIVNGILGIVDVMEYGKHVDKMWVVIDGKFGEVDHSWLVWRGDEKVIILDTYAVGSLPQVQLVDVQRLLPERYFAGPCRTDINMEFVDRQVKGLKRTR